MNGANGTMTKEAAREMISGALMSDDPQAFFRSVDDNHPCAPYLAPLLALRGVPQNPEYHPEGDAFEHTMLVLERAARERSRAQQPHMFMMSALTHDLGKAECTRRNEKGAWASIGHDTVGAKIAFRWLQSLGYPVEEAMYSNNMCRLHMRVHQCYRDHMKLKKTEKLFMEAYYPEDLILLAACDTGGKGDGIAVEEEAYLRERLRECRLRRNKTGKTAPKEE